MVKFIYPHLSEFKTFTLILKDNKFTIGKYLPPINEKWYKVVVACVEYVEHTSSYEENKSIYEVTARILYKVAKKHELDDGNKRNAVICAYLFCLINNYAIISPEKLKLLAKGIAKTKGRMNEEIILPME